MGIDLMDVSFRLERELPLKLERDFWDNCYESAKRRQTVGEFVDIRVQDVFEELVRRLRSDGLYDSDSGNLSLMHREIASRLGQLFPGSEVQLDSKFQTLFGRRIDSADWDTIAAAFSVQKPDSGCSGTTLLVVPAWVLAVGLLGTASYAAGVPLWVILGLGTASCMWLMSWRLRGDASRFPPEIVTVRDLANHILVERCRVKKPGESQARWQDELIWFVLKGVLVSALGVDDDEVVPEAGLIKDLGAS